MEVADIVEKISSIPIYEGTVLPALRTKLRAMVKQLINYRAVERLRFSSKNEAVLAETSLSKEHGEANRSLVSGEQREKPFCTHCHKTGV